jgi:hypothetical protein
MTNMVRDKHSGGVGAKRKYITCNNVDLQASADRAGDHGKLLAIGLRTLLDQMDRVAGELLQWLNEHFVDTLLFRHLLRIETPQKRMERKR